MLHTSSLHSLTSALLVDTDKHQHAKFSIRVPQTTVDTVSPHVQELFPVKTPCAPLLELLAPALIKFGHQSRRHVASGIAEQLLKRVANFVAADLFEIQLWDELFHAFGAEPIWQHQQRAKRQLLIGTRAHRHHH